MENYTDIQGAMSFYGTTRSGIYKRASRGRLPFKDIDGTRFFLLDESLQKPHASSKPKEFTHKPVVVSSAELESFGKLKNHPPKIKEEVVSVKEEYEEDEYSMVEIDVPDNLLCNYDFVRDQISSACEITPLVEAKIFEYVTVYNNYWNLYHSTHAQPIFGTKINPMFAVVENEYKKLKDLERQLGIGMKNSKDLAIEKAKESNPFEEFMR